MTVLAAPCHTRRPITGWAIVRLPGRRLGLLGVTSSGPHSEFGWIDGEDRRASVDQSDVLYRIAREDVARRAIAAAAPHWVTRNFGDFFAAIVAAVEGAKG